MSSLLFLDADGCLNTRPGSLDADKLDLIAQIQRETGCRIVVSSSWRKVERQLLRLLKALLDRGCAVAGFTPCLDIKDGEIWIAKPRWMEINEWLSMDPKGLNYAILDDEEMGPLNDHLVRTDSSVGLTPKLAAEVIQRLKSQPNQPK